jgi:cytoskeletal protein CcmA (bactofilin family)
LPREAPSVERERIATVTIYSYVGSNTTVKGNLECSEDFLIEGAVEGNLHSEGMIVLGKDAVVRGEVSAKEVAISGTVVGTIRCSGRVEIFASAKIVGTVQTPVLKMEPGAKVRARIIMSPNLEAVELISGSPKDPFAEAVQH